MKTKTDIFISYAWTSDLHRDWVRLLAAQLRQLGYTVKIDDSEPYGTSLSGFMREAVNAARVLMVADENYVERADNKPESGVGIENGWIRDAYKDKPVSWLSVLYVRNPAFLLPAWLRPLQIKGFNFNSNSEKKDFPGEAQLDDLWRWMEGLPADKAHAITSKIYLERKAQLEKIDAMRDPAHYASPELEGRVTFRYKDHRNYTVGHGEYQFKIDFSDRGKDSVYVYIDSGLKAVGVITSKQYDPKTVGSFLRPGRAAEPVQGQSVVLLNSAGALCVIDIESIQPEVNAETYVPAAVTFSYRVLVDR